MESKCIFCEIAHGTRPASVVYADDLTMAFIDIRQFHAGHTLVISAIWTRHPELRLWLPSVA